MVFLVVLRPAFAFPELPPRASLLAADPPSLARLLSVGSPSDTVLGNLRGFSEIGFRRLAMVCRPRNLSRVFRDWYPVGDGSLALGYRSRKPARILRDWYPVARHGLPPSELGADSPRLVSG